MTPTPRRESQNATPTRLHRPANDNQARPATREEMRIGIILDWWEGELARLMRNRTGEERWRREHREALHMVTRFSASMNNLRAG